MTEVAPGVSLEVLDWGGSGRSIVLLAGGGNTAHVFDTFAPLLAARHHVYGITRRGYGASSKPTSGYDGAGLADDVMAVLEHLEIDRPILVGHSVAGDELTSIGARHGDRIAGLVYLEAAYDRSDPAWTEINSKLPPTAPTPADRESVQALAGYMTRTLGTAIPQAEIYNEFEFTSDRHVGRFRIPQNVSRAIAAGVSKPDYARVRVPVLAIYAQLVSIENLPGYKANDPAVKAALEEYRALTTARQRLESVAFQTSARDSSVVWLAGSHYVFLSDGEGTAREIERFVEALR